MTPSFRFAAALALALTAVAPLAAVNKYVAVGDSITAGSSWPASCGICPVVFDCTGGCAGSAVGRENCGHVRRLESWLGAGNNVINEGVGGEDTSEALADFLNKLDPDCGSPGDCIAVLLMHGTNDMGGAVSPETAKANLSAMIDIAKGRKIDVLLMTIVRQVYDWDDPKWSSYRDKILALATAKNLQSVDPYAPLCNDNYACYNRNYWVDMPPAQSGPTDCTPPGQGDTNGNGAVGHLDPDGYDILTDKIKLAFPAAVPAAPAGATPTGDIAATAPNFVWSAVAGARWYQLEVDGSTTWWEGAAVCSGGTCTANPGVALPQGSHSWRVKGRNLRGLGAFSAAKNFVIWGTPETPVGSSPTGTFGDSDPMNPPFGWEPYSWSKPANATDYDLVVSNAGGPVLQQSFTSAICPGSTCNASPSAGLPMGSYTWTVQARNPAVAGAASAPLAFEIVGPPGAPTPTRPTGVLFEMAPRYEWLEAPGATEYDLEVRDAGTNVDAQAVALSAASVCSAGRCSHVEGTVLAPDDYTLKVRGRNGAGEGPLSSPGADFTIIPCTDSSQKDLADYQPSPVMTTEIVEHCGWLTGAAWASYTIEATGNLTVHTRDGFVAHNGFTVAGQLSVNSP